MSSDVVIRAEGLGKKYVIGHQAAERTPTLRDAITRNVHNFARTTKDLLGGRALIAGDEIEEFWALKDVSFEIKRGDVVGIIGRNGAGKSTLLKVLSRITEPSEGRVEIRGRVASLLEVGTGFHPELTGRENIYLNGAILGMTRAEIRRKFDEIVDFSGVEKFLDTPVKRFSSGMYVRLAFAVAAHLEPDILVVDEVLAVGDAEFQKKCLGKMQDVAGHGRTVLFVSHNMSAVLALCPTSIWMKHGTVGGHSNTEDIVHEYARQNALAGRENAEETIQIRVDHKCALNGQIKLSGSITPPLATGKPFITLAFYSDFGFPVFSATKRIYGEAAPYFFEYFVEPKGLKSCSLVIHAWAGFGNEVTASTKNAASFDFHGSQDRDGLPIEHFGAIAFPEQPTGDM